MNMTQKSVLEFMMKAGQPVCTGDAAELAARLITEEALETVQALIFNVVNKLGGGWKHLPINIANVGRRPIDLVEVIDGACDTQYVLYWTLNMLGIDGDLFMEEVCKNNLLKVVNPQFDENGKLKKPDGHKPPNITGILANKDCYFFPCFGKISWCVRYVNQVTFKEFQVDLQRFPDGYITLEYGRYMFYEEGRSKKLENCFFDRSEQ